ncbi:FliI/YscN family ATPase [Stenotrophomonas indicatrix]|uniref:FliI/YscN family ATPase n=1 Tax=Stenotrophomonas indicatrix TaxID=2045451 RepID=UPI00300B2EEE
MASCPVWRVCAHPIAIAGSMLRVPLAQLAIGELCLLYADASSNAVIGEAVVVAIDQGVASLGLLQHSTGLSVQCLVVPCGRSPSVMASAALLGSVLDGNGQCVQRLVPPKAGPGIWRALAGQAGDYRQRRPITLPLVTGVRAIDGLLTCGHGQRVGIFAGAGAGKTTLLEMLLANAQADVLIVALIGERGREVAELVQRIEQSPRASQCIIIQATSDAAPAVRCNAALLAMTLAEHFRDEGLQVALMLDSITRYARAMRELALGAGELPSRGGYPASVFEALPRLLERSGRSEHGSITLFCTVLLEHEQDVDPIGDEVKSLIDGHFYLSSTLAGRGHFPALDVLRSASRLFNQLTSSSQQLAAARVRGLLGTLDDLRLMRELGEYKPGLSPHYDQAVNAELRLMEFLRQGTEDISEIEQTLGDLYAIEG